MTVLRIIPKGDLMLRNRTTSVIRGAAYARQRISVSLDIFLGEWFLDKRVGIPYFRDILIHSPNSDVVESVLKKGIMNTWGIVSIPSLSVTLDKVNALATVDYVAVYQDGTQIAQQLALVI